MDEGKISVQLLTKHFESLTKNYSDSGASPAVKIGNKELKRQIQSTKSELVEGIKLIDEKEIPNTIDENERSSFDEEKSEEVEKQRSDTQNLDTVDDSEDIDDKLIEESLYEEIRDNDSCPEDFSEQGNDDKEHNKVLYGNMHTLSKTAYENLQSDEDDSSDWDKDESSESEEEESIDESYIQIERIRYPEENSANSSSERTSQILSRNNSDSPEKRLLHLIKELKNTEIKYCEDLDKIVKEYIPYIEKNTPPHQHDVLRVELVGNISIICEHQKRFLNEILNCEENVDLIAKAFIENESLFELYPLYLQNKPKSNTVLKELLPTLKQMQEHFGERLDFSAYLLTPLQRLGKYILLMESMEKEMKILQQSCENTQKALNMIKYVISKGNDCVAIGSILKSPLSTEDYGSFIIRDKFTIIKPIRVEVMVFLFSNVVVFTVEEQQSIELFTYYDSIKMDELTISNFEDGTIHLTDFTKTKRSSFILPQYTYVLETKIDKVRNSWRKTIEQMLWQQLARHKADALKTLQSQE